MQLRPYQQKAVSDIYSAFREHNRVMLTMPTGAGKTQTFVSICEKAHNSDRRVLILVHRGELLTQALDKLLALGITPGLIKSGESSSIFRPIQIASIQTLIKRSLPPQLKFNLIIVDEAHHSPAASYKATFERFPEAKILGVTATPCRLNGDGFDMFDKLVHGPTVKQLINDKYLVLSRVFTLPLKSQLSKIRVRNGDYVVSELEQIMGSKQLIGNLISNYKKIAEGRKNLVFATSVAHSIQIKEAYNEAGIEAAHIDGTTPDNERRQILSDFAKGKVRVLTNVEIVTEGVDIPDVDCVQLARPTKSVSLYLQMVGRGLRPANGKENCIILDHANCVLEHGLPEEDRNWTLEGYKKPRERAIMVKMKDGHSQLFVGKNGELELPIELSGYELEEFTGETFRIKEFFRLASLAQQKGFKNGFAYYKFMDSVLGWPTYQELQIIGAKLGYHKGWAYHKAKEIGVYPGDVNYSEELLTQAIDVSRLLSCSNKQLEEMGYNDKEVQDLAQRVQNSRYYAMIMAK